jgi:hypothetical protein
MAIPIVGTKPEAQGTITATFPNGHEINGLQLKVDNVTAEQIAVVVFYLNRVAMSMMDAALYAKARQDAEVAAVSREIAAEKRRD